MVAVCCRNIGKTVPIWLVCVKRLTYQKYLPLRHFQDVYTCAQVCMVCVCTCKCASVYGVCVHVQVCKCVWCVCARASVRVCSVCVCARAGVQVHVYICEYACLCACVCITLCTNIICVYVCLLHILTYIHKYILYVNSSKCSTVTHFLLSSFEICSKLLFFVSGTTRKMKTTERNATAPYTK